MASTPVAFDCLNDPNLLIPDLAPTPYFLFDREIIRHRYREFHRVFPGSRVHYAMKANSDPEVLKTLATEGSCFEVASVHELHLLQTIGIPPERILYGSAIKPTAHLAEFAAYGVNRFAFDTVSELEKIAAIAPGARVFVRAKVDDAESQFAFSEKFGAETDDLIPLLMRARDLNLHPIGISFHVGSQSRNARAWGNAIHQIAPVIRDLFTHDLTLEFLNLGGGFPCAYAADECPSVDAIAAYTLAECDKLPYQPSLILEPGRALVADAAVLMTRVVARVRRGNRHWLFLDAGVYNALFEAMACQGTTRFPITAVAGNRHRPTAMFDLAGPTGDGLDVVARVVSLPDDTNEGDVLCVHKAGAYTLSIASHFNGFPPPKVLWR